jgi:hypothetical protein
MAGDQTADRFFIRIKIVAHNDLAFGQRQADIVQPDKSMLTLFRARGHREAYRLPRPGNPSGQVQASDVKGRLGPQHVEETKNVIAGPGKRVCYLVDPSVVQLG